ncbi:hypothetical protein [Aurantimonas sp. HBX-1]|uniref:hypothetical protein n=1 Tax=Aurantimonas sp. HBX-1 TaxID=2906072 RepID=UPI001F34B42E|nr:hypothetical protein [Aurantimonas sp. HBX-1]UIJ70319.1 hypothetical protein LXB15_11060 [Aurantimonas sp. HBX-1]
MFITETADLSDRAKIFEISAASIARMNQIQKRHQFRSNVDALVTAKIYYNSDVLVNDGIINGDPWGINFLHHFDMSNDSSLFKKAAFLRSEGFHLSGIEWLYEGNSKSVRFLPLYEAKMCDLYNHRAAGYSADQIERGYRALPDTDLASYADREFNPLPFYWVEWEIAVSRMPISTSPYLLGFRDISTSITERSFIPTFIPLSAVGNIIPLIFCKNANKSLLLGLYCNLSSMVFDYVARQKMGRLHFNYFIVKQPPVKNQEFYTESRLVFVTSRVLELTYTSWSMQPFAIDLGYDGEPFIWDEDRRALLRAELDAFYAAAYGLTRDELRYVLDPADVKGPDYPSETFRVLKNREMREYGEYRTRRLVLEAWDRFTEDGTFASLDLHSAEPVPDLTPQATLPERADNAAA